MPDGRPLGVFLTESNLMESRSKRRPRKEPVKDGWSSRSSAATQTTTTTTTSTTSHPQTSREQMTDAEYAELIAVSKVGQRRQRRWMNDKLLRDMAPALTAKDMESLFKPAPFGETGYISAFTLAADPEYAPLWELFRSVDADKQDRVLLKWAAHVEELRASVEVKPRVDANLMGATVALQGWAAIAPRGRKALRRASRGCVQELEAPMLRLLDGVSSAEEGERGVTIETEDCFGRLLVHSLAHFHGLLANTAAGSNANGKRDVVVKKKTQSSGSRDEVSPEKVEASSSNSSSTGSSASGAAVPAAASSSSSSPAAAAAFPVQRITCVDIIFLLEDDELEGELNARSLNEALHGGRHEMEQQQQHSAAAAAVEVAAVS